jgi:hypothetical protein
MMCPQFLMKRETIRLLHNKWSLGTMNAFILLVLTRFGGVPRITFSMSTV